MREIKFRGKRSDNGKWEVGGVLIDQENNYSAILKYSDYHGWHGFIEIDPATIGQFTGLLDKQGKEIYEGDITKCWSCSRYEYHVVEDIMRIYATCSETYEALRPYGDYEIVGNIYEHPELIPVD